MRAGSSSSSASSPRGSGRARRPKRAPARSHILRAAVLGLLTLIPLRAAEAITVTYDRPGEHPLGWYGVEIGPTFSLPLPAASANRDVIGLDAGLSITAKPSRMVGLGVDVAYHYWPASAEFKQKFNDFLGEKTWNTLMLGGDAWGLQVVEYGGHVRIAAPDTYRVRPWLQVGAGLYKVDPHTSGYSGDAGFFWVIARPLPRTEHFGSSVTIGGDLFSARHARMGLDATYHYVGCRDTYGDDLRIFTLGAHVLFGW